MTPALDDAGTQRVCILGATGSVGVSTLDVIARHPDRFEVFALTAHSRVDELLAQCVRWRPRYAAVRRRARRRARCAERLRDAGVAHRGAERRRRAVRARRASRGRRGDGRHRRRRRPGAVPGRGARRQAAAAGQQGSAGRRRRAVHATRCARAARRCCRSTASTRRSSSACRKTARPGTSASTTSSSPPRAARSATAIRRRLRDVTPDEACAHPNWVMGRKISVDSATMMNKALEVIEARWLFDLRARADRGRDPSAEHHPLDGASAATSSVLAQLGTPDMRVPIAYGLACPERIESGAEPLDFAHARRADLRGRRRARAFPACSLAWDALRGPPGTTAVLNAANEDGGRGLPRRNASASTRFTRVNAGTLERVLPGQARPTRSKACSRSTPSARAARRRSSDARAIEPRMT